MRIGAHVNRALAYFKLSHVTYILLLCDLWQRWAVGRVFVCVQAPSYSSLGFGESFSQHIFHTEIQIVFFNVNQKEDMIRISPKFSVAE